MEVCQRKKRKTLPKPNLSDQCTFASAPAINPWERLNGFFLIKRLFRTTQASTNVKDTITNPTWIVVNKVRKSVLICEVRAYIVHLLDPRYKRPTGAVIPPGQKH